MDSWYHRMGAFVRRKSFQVPIALISLVGPDQLRNVGRPVKVRAKGSPLLPVTPLALGCRLAKRPPRNSVQQKRPLNSELA